jgi:hypothetical protein
MSELSCGTRFICRNETLDLSLYLLVAAFFLGAAFFLLVSLYA